MIARWIGRGLRRVLFAASVLFIFAYLIDWSVYKFRGSPHDRVTISRYMAIPLKGSRQEFADLGAFDQPCARALFPQDAMSPCWQVRRHAIQSVEP